LTTNVVALAAAIGWENRAEKVAVREMKLEDPTYGVGLRAATASALTVRVVLPLAPPGAVAIIVVVPFATAVTSPDALTVATVGPLLVHVNVAPLTTLFEASRAVAVICCVAPKVSVGVAGVTATVAPR
jgi:hypothetical protein